MLTTRQAALVILAASIALVGGALLFEHVGGLPPCTLCLYERWPYYAAIPLAATGFALGGGGARVIVGVSGVMFVASAVLAFYHVGVEQHWFAGPTGCTGAAAVGGSIEALKAQILSMKPVRCDEIPWSLFGISLAGWNFLGSLGLAAFGLWVAARPAASSAVPQMAGARS